MSEWSSKEEIAFIAFITVCGGCSFVAAMLAALLDHLIVMQVAALVGVASCAIAFGFIYWKQPLP